MSSSILKCIALYNFQSSATVELQLQKGDIVIVRNADVGDGWCEGELYGKRGLFPKAYVQMLDEHESNDGSSPHNSLSNVTFQAPPLTPQSNKKVFMETLLTPTPNTIDEVFDEDKATELFASDHNNIQITAGPRWNQKPPSLTITVVDGQKQLRSSGIRLHKFYEVRTKELKVTVQRRYKQFLWLYDQLAEKCPCISLPPLPIKHGLPTDNEDDFKESRRRGLERFLNRVVRHPILGCTKIIHIFLIATDDKEWRIGAGKHSSFIKVGASKSNKKLFTAPIYHTVHYPPYNVPLNQLPAFVRFSKFSEMLESNVTSLTRSCEVLKSSDAYMSRCIRNLGRDLHSLAKGSAPSLSGRHLPKVSQGISLPSNPVASISLLSRSSFDIESGEDDETDQDSTGISEWNWREDDKFTKLMIEIQDIGTRMRQLSTQHISHQEKLELDVIEGFEEYSGIIHTLPVLVKMHEEAMAAYNQCKQKGSRKEAETMRQDCETLNNILLAELDYFSSLMIEDFQGIILKLLKEQADYHKKLATEWESMYESFHENRPIRRATVKRSTTVPGRHSSTTINQLQRPASSDESPPTIPRTYKKVATSQVNGHTDDSHLYVNICKLPQTTSEDSPIYQNFIHSKPQLTLPATPIPPPPIVIKRHEMSSSPEDAELKGKQTDSFIVPNLHYSQVSVMGPREEDEYMDTTATPKKPLTAPPPPPPPKDKPNTTTRMIPDESVSDEVKTTESIPEEESKPNPPPPISYSPKMHTKLAKLTKLPTSSTKSRSAKSFSQASWTPLPKPVGGGGGGARTLPRGQTRDEEKDKNGSELFQKLQERRQKLERQLSSTDVEEHDVRDSSSSEGVLRWTSGHTSNTNSLTKFGIIEEGGTFIV